MLQSFEAHGKETVEQELSTGGCPSRVVRDSDVRVGYRVKPSPMRQAMYNGRLELRPEINLDDYKFRAVIDWIEIEFDTPCRHQAINIQKWAAETLSDAAQTVYVMGSGREKGFIGQSFIMRMQNPTCREFHALCAALEENYKISSDEGLAIRMNGIEVSLDIYPKSKADADRRMMTDTLRRHLWVYGFFWEDRLSCPRFVRETTGGRTRTDYLVQEPRDRHRKLSDAASDLEATPEHFRDLDIKSYLQPPVNGTFYVGERDGVAMIRVQDKVTDNRRDGMADDLPPEKRRTRIEVTLDRKMLCEMRIEFPADLEDLPFSRLASGVFCGFIPTAPVVEDGPDPREVEVFSRAGVIGLDRYQRATVVEARRVWVRRKGARKPALVGKKGFGIVWAELNVKSTKALQHLAKRWVMRRRGTKGRVTR